MTHRYYSEYVTHCLRFYARHENPVFRTDVDKHNWEACDRAIKSFSPFEQQMLLFIFRERDTLEDNIYQLARARCVSQKYIWELAGKLERQVANERGLL